MFNVVLFDDHSFVTDAVKAYMSEKSNVRVVASFQDSFELLTTLPKLGDVHILIADVLTDDDIGLSLFENMVKNFPNIRVIVFSSIKSEFLVNNLKKLGVFDIVKKKDGIDALYQSLLRVAIKDNDIEVEVEIPTSLTNKEKIIVEHLLQGLQAKEIAKLTHSSFHTINNQKNKLIEKFNCNNTTELIVKLVRLGLVSVT